MRIALKNSFYMTLGVMLGVTIILFVSSVIISKVYLWQGGFNIDIDRNKIPWVLVDGEQGFFTKITADITSRAEEARAASIGARVGEYLRFTSRISDIGTLIIPPLTCGIALGIYNSKEKKQANEEEFGILIDSSETYTNNITLERAFGLPMM